MAIRFSDLRLSLFPLGLEIRNIKDFPLRSENLVSFAGVNVYLPPTSLFMKKKAISIEIDRPRFIFNESLLKGEPASDGLGSSFAISRVSIRRGELIFKGEKIQGHLLDFNLRTGSGSEGLSFRLDSPHMKIILPVSGEPVTLEGNVTGEAHQQGTSWKVNQLAWQTRDILFNFNGRVFQDGAFQINASAKGTPEHILYPLLEELAVKGLTYANAKMTREANGPVKVVADFYSPACRVKENPCSNLSGKLSWDSLNRYLNLETAFSTPLARASLRLGSKESATSIAVENIPAAYVADILDIRSDAPLEGIVRRGSLQIDSRRIQGRAELDAAPGRDLDRPFMVRGSIDFERDKQAKRTTFSGRQLRFDGGRLSISGKTDSLAKTTLITISADLDNVEKTAPYSAYYLEIDLLPWKLSRGGGVFQLEIDKRPGRKAIASRFQIRNFLASQQPIRSLQGEFLSTPPHGRGIITIAAADLNSRAELEVSPGRTTIHFPNLAGEAQKIMKILNLDMDLRGRVQGDFTYRSGKALPEPELDGSLTAPRLVFMGYGLERVAGRLHTNLKGISLSGLEFVYKGGLAKAEVSIDYARKRFAMRGRIDGIDVSRLSRNFTGRADLEIGGSGEFFKQPLEIDYRLRDIHFYRDRGFSVKGKAKILTDFSDFQLTTTGEVDNPAGAFPFALELRRGGQRYSGSFHLNLNNLDLLIPWRNNIGSMRLLGQFFTRADGGIGSRGVAIFSGRTLSLPNFSHSLDNFNGTVTFVDQSFSLQSLSGEMGGGKVEGNGRLLIADGDLSSMTFSLQGRDLRLYPMDRTSCLVNPDLTLKYEGKKLLLSGTLAFQAVDWQREIDERIVFSTRSELSTAESKIREMLRLDIAMHSENILMNNSLGRIRGRFKLRLTGNASFPILIGTCEGREGEIYFSDRTFNVLKAKLVFNNNFLIDPLIHVESEAFIQNYRIRFDIRGNASRAKPELVSSPPLPPQDILALVSLGETFKRSGSAETSSLEGSTAMITTKLTEEIKNRANKLLGINLLRIDPVLSGQSSVDTSRLTIGKTISKNLVFVYSTNLSTSRREILYLQYQLSPAISLIAIRNEEGRYSLDLRLRSRR